MIESIHYRTTMDVASVTGASLTFADLVWEVTGWIRAKEGPTARLKAPWALREGTWRKPDDGRSSVEVQSYWEAADAPAPEFWALRYTHADRDVPARRWTTDVGIVPTGPSQWRFALTVGNSLPNTYLGREPDRLPVTPPRVVRELATSGKWICTAGSVRLAGSPKTIPVGKGNVLRGAISDPGRSCAIVYVSRDRSSGEPLVDPIRLARAIVGTSVVYLAGSPELDEELEHLIPLEFRCPNGMVRLYAPDADLDDPGQMYRHRFFTRRQIEDLGAAEVEEQMARSLTRRVGWGLIRSSVTSIDDVGARRRELRRVQLQGQTDAASRNELLELYEAANTELTEQVEVLTRDKGATEQRAEQLQAELSELSDKVRNLEYQSETLRAHATSARREASSAADAVKTAHSIADLPTNVEEVMQIFERLHAGRIVFTDSAKSSARKSAINKDREGPSIVWRHLHAAATVLPRLAFEARVSAGQLPGQFKKETGGIELSMTESSATKADGKLLSIRKILFDGKEWDMSPHIKFGNKPPRCLRIHLALDPHQQRVIVGHCGDHLDTAGTRRRG